MRSCLLASHVLLAHWPPNPMCCWPAGHQTPQHTWAKGELPPPAPNRRCWQPMEIAAALLIYNRKL